MIGETPGEKDFTDGEEALIAGRGCDEGPGRPAGWPLSSNADLRTASRGRRRPTIGVSGAGYQT